MQIIKEKAYPKVSSIHTKDLIIKRTLKKVKYEGRINMKIISVVNYKGGTGKTTVTFNFARELSEKYKVLLIDFDGQGNLSKISNVCKDVDLLDKTIASDLQQLIRSDEVNINVYKTDNKNIDILPCNMHMADVKVEMLMTLSRETILKRFLHKIKELRYYDYVLIDNAPSVEIDFINSLSAADEMLIVAAPDTFSTEGIYNLLKKYEIVKKYFNKNIKISGILLNNVDLRTNFSKDMINLIKKHWSDINVFNTIIPSSIKVKEAQAMQKAVKEYEPQNKVAIAFSSFTDEYLSL